MKRFKIICYYCLPGVHSLCSGNRGSGVLLLCAFSISLLVLILRWGNILSISQMQAEQKIAIAFLLFLFLSATFININIVRNSLKTQIEYMSRFNVANELIKKIGRDNFALGAITIIFLLLCIAFLCPLIAPYHPDVQNIAQNSRFQAPSFSHLFGTDKFGRDIFSRILYGTQISLGIGICAVFFSISIGTIFGAIAGYFGGIIDGLLMRIVDIFFAFPRLFLILLFIAIFSPSILMVIIVLSLTGWMTVARLIRAEILLQKNQEYASAAEVLGFSKFRILFKHILPNSLTPALVALSLRIGNVILTESTLSFLGLGVQPPTASWGNMIYDGRANLLDAWWISLFPGIAIIVTIISFNILGDSIRDALDPKLTF